MKKLLSITLLLLTTLTARAQVLEAKSFNEFISAIQQSEFEYRETGKIFGFQTTQSCLYVSEDIAIFKNYCFPERPYPARGYTIISKEFGMIDLYEEKLPGVLKRDVVITQFPDILAPYLTTGIPDSTLHGLSSMIEKMYHRYFPGCWSTNYSWETEVPVASCTGNSTVMNFDLWASETQKILSEEKQWLDLMKTIQAKLK